ncbi:uncharacterized protein LOC133842648 [Drosophila sulfurigaster albostrigata]|uniref:uncharacterized protein LOC133842648 n=1 Tax=Drosophila sulfurigaster albostrigata TaxID=89887 RepID=UPI002D21CEAA|nr:uncharacterized protein LOC133842648 [Drosophila sulfurigaster albostrigata]
MMNIFTTVLLFLPVSVNSINRTNGESLNFCPACAQWIISDCKVNKKSVSIDKDEDAYKLRYLQQGETVDPKLEKCLDDNLKVVGELTSFICMKSMRKGCLVVGNKKQFAIQNSLSYVCRYCAFYCECEKLIDSSSILNSYLSVSCVSCVVFIMLYHIFIFIN